MGYLSITLKIHNPGQGKSQVLSTALERYTKSFDRLMKEAKPNLDDIEQNHSGSLLQLSGWIDKDLSKSLNEFYAEPFKDSLKSDFAMALDSFLKRKKAGGQDAFPFIYPEKDGVLQRVRPIFFCRYDQKRNFCFLQHVETKRYYVKVYLLSLKNAIEQKNHKEDTETKLQYIHKDGRMMEENERRQRYILLPLSFGAWQEQYIKLWHEDSTMIKTGRLFQRNGDFYLSVTMKMKVPESVKTATWMGVSRGTKKPIFYAIVDEMGNQKETSVVKLKKESLPIKKEEVEIGLHRAANQIVAKAHQHKAQVVLENVRLMRDDFPKGKDVKDTLAIGPARYIRLEQIVSYKLERVGLPKPIKVSPAGLFFTCPHCGKNTKKNRVAKDMFLCVSCGAAYPIDLLASINLANRLRKYQSEDIKIIVKQEKGTFRFTNEILGLDFKRKSIEIAMLDLKEELQVAIDNIKNNSNPEESSERVKRKWSMIKKMEGYEDLMKHVKLV